MSRKTSVARSRRSRQRVTSRKPFWIAISSRHATARDCRRDVVAAFVGPVRRRLLNRVHAYIRARIHE